MSRKSLLALLLAVVQIICGCAVFAAEAEDAVPAASGPVTATLSVAVNTDGIPQLLNALLSENPSLSGLVDPALSILQNLSLQLVWDGPDMQLDVLLKGHPLAYAAMKNEGAVITAVSDILPDNTMFLITPDDLFYTGGSIPLDLRFTVEDLHTVENVVQDYLKILDDRIAICTGEEETGSWTLDGVTYTSRRRITANVREIYAMALTVLKDLACDARSVALLQRFTAMTPESLMLDDRIREQQDASYEDLPSLEAYRYSNCAGDVLTDAVIARYSDFYYLRYGIVSRNFTLRFVAPSVLDVFLTTDSLSSGYDFSASFGRIYVGYDTVITGKLLASGRTAQDGSREGRLSCQVSGIDVLDIIYTVRNGGAVTASFDPFARRLLRPYDIGYDFTRQLQGKLQEALGRMVSIMPDEATVIVSRLMSLFTY